MNVLCVLQARVTSTRLPGKVLQPILGQPMLARQIERIRRARRIDSVVVATSAEPSDDALERLCAGLGVACHRGSLDDVLDRLHGAAAPYSPGDCPLTDPALLDALIELHRGGHYDYSSNVMKRTFPDGLDAEVFTSALLLRAWRDATSPFDREHVTPFMYRAESGARCGSLTDVVDRGLMRWTVDYAEDFEFVSRVFEALYFGNPNFDTDDVHRLLDAHPEIAAISAHHAENRETP
jgi:spore coat polysaccharide biosynthesis protein SpsF